MGFDRGLIAAYGQDDRLAAYAALRAVLEVENPQKTTMAYLVDNEEVDNRNNTGARSDHFTDLLSRLVYRELGSDYREPLFRPDPASDAICQRRCESRNQSDEPRRLGAGECSETRVWGKPEALWSGEQRQLRVCGMDQGAAG